jgi:formiminotetrahydrofolate cyclodeaminase
LSKKLQEWEKSGARVQDNSSETAELPEEIANASIDFQNLSNRLIQKSKVLAVEDFRKLAYAVELEVKNSKLSEIKKDFLLRELAALKAIMSILEKKSENARIMCDSDFECKVLACVQQRVEDALSEDKTWLERLINTIEMPETIPYWWVYCILEYFEEG